jgi:hypothetical protein
VDLLVDLAAESSAPELTEPDVFDRLKVVVSGPGSEEDLAAAIAAVGRLEPGGEHAYLAVEPLARLAGERGEDPEWRSRYEGMLAYASGEGWVDSEGRVRAHVEWIDGPPPA